MTGFVLFFAVACLGGVIATVGDRIGMKVGKSRLSLFNLRPRQTATLVSVVTGMIASFATLTLLFLLDGSLRKGVFQLDDIQLALSEAQTDLEATEAEKEQAESTLAKSTKLQAQAQARLSETNKSLQTAIAREEETLTNLLDTQSQLDEVSEQAGSLRNEIGNLRSEREALIDEQAKVRSQIAQRDREITQRNAEIAQRNEQIAQRDQQLQQRTADLSERNQQLQQRTTDLSERDQQIAQRNTEIAERETRLEGLQKKQAFLTEEITRLEEEFQGLRLGNVAIARNQTLAYTVARPDSEQNAVQAVEQALAEANRFAVQTILPRTDTVDNFTLRFDPLAVAEIVRSITDRQSYVIKVSSAANYVIGESCVAEALSKSGPPCLLVNVAAVPNEIIYQPGDVLASVSVSSEDILNERLVERFIILQATAEFEARRSGIIRYRPIIANGLPEPLNDFLTRVDAYGESIEIQAFASQPIYPTGPVYLELAAVKDGDVLFRTRAAASP